MTLERAARLGPRVEMQQLTFRRVPPPPGRWELGSSHGLLGTVPGHGPAGSAGSARLHRHAQGAPSPRFPQRPGGVWTETGQGVCVPTRPGGSQPRRCCRAARGVAGVGLSPPSLREGLQARGSRHHPHNTVIPQTPHTCLCAAHAAVLYHRESTAESSLTLFKTGLEEPSETFKLEVK